MGDWIRPGGSGSSMGSAFAIPKPESNRKPFLLWSVWIVCWDLLIVAYCCSVWVVWFRWWWRARCPSSGDCPLNKWWSTNFLQNFLWGSCYICSVEWVPHQVGLEAVLCNMSICQWQLWWKFEGLALPLLLGSRSYGQLQRVLMWWGVLGC